MLDWLKNIFLYSEDSPLLFTQLYFWVFVAIILFFYTFIYKKSKLRNTYLFIFSLFFYYKTGGYYFSLLIFSTLVEYATGYFIYRSQKLYTRRFLLLVSLIVNLSLLGFYKYSYFFIENLNNIFGTNFKVVNILAVWSNSIAGTHLDVSTIILPVGISFYVFQTISYSFDVYRYKIKPVTNIIDFGFYVTFFPQLVAGPIVRAAEFIPQLYQKYALNAQVMGHALFLILNGLIKKILISDFISINYVDRVFEAPLSYSGFENLMAAYGYSIQIYCDFSGYTDIAIGVALLFGFRLPVNFNSPYKAINITDFWRRWHISLSTWLRDYLYISLGGNKKGKFRMYINLAITMILGGLWHGPNIRFIIWGAIHGLSLIFHKIWSNLVPSSTHLTGYKKVFAIFLTFQTVTFSWIFFRASDLATANMMFDQIAHNFMPGLIPEMISSYKVIYGIIVFGLIAHWLPSMWKERLRGSFIKTPYLIKALIVVAIVFVLYQVKSTELQPFIYFQF